MSRDLTTITMALPDMAETGRMDRLIASFNLEVDGIDDCRIDRMPNHEERQLLQERNRTLRSMLRPYVETMTDKEKVGRAIVLMLQRYPQFMTRDISVQKAAEPYMTLVERLPAFAIQMACDDVVHNRVPGLDPDWPPTAVRVEKEAKRCAAGAATEQMAIDRILTARKLLRNVVSDEAKERIHHGLKELANRLDAEEDDRRRVVRARVSAENMAFTERKILEEYAAQGAEPVRSGNGMLISPSLAAQIRERGGHPSK